MTTKRKPTLRGGVQTVVYGGWGAGTAGLAITRTEITHGRYTVTGRWEGPPNALLEVSDYMLTCYVTEDHPLTHEFGFPQRINLFGYPLRLVDDTERLSRHSALYARTDVGFGFPAVAHRVRRAWKRHADLLTARMVLTLAVWGLAYVPVGEVPGWWHVGKKRP